MANERPRPSPMPIAGAHLGADGILREPFALIPLAWLSGLAGAALDAIAVKRGR